MTQQAIIDLLKQALEEYAKFANWTSCTDKNNHHVSTWYKQEDGYVLAREVLKRVKEYEDVTTNQGTN